MTFIRNQYKYKRMKWLKSYLPICTFLLGLNLVLLSPLLVLGLKFLILFLFFLLVLNLYLLFFSQLQLFKSMEVYSFTPQDSWGVHDLSRKLSQKYSIKNISCYKSKASFPFSLCFGNSQKYSIVLSEQLLELLSFKEIETLLNYYFYVVSKKSVFYFSVLSAFIYLINQILFIINFPVYFFRKRKHQQASTWIHLFLSWTTKKRLSQLDKDFSADSGQSKELAFLLWNLHFIYKINKKSIPIHWHLLSIVSDGLFPNIDHSLYPDIKLRIKNLVGDYPPPVLKT